MGCFLFPREADPVLIIDAETMLTASLPLQCFQAIAGRNQEIGERLSAVKRGEAAQCHKRDILEFLDPFAIPQSLGFLTLKASDQLLE